MLKPSTGALRRGRDQQESELKLETPQFPLDRDYFRIRLVLEHHVLRRMDDGGRCIMSKMEPARGIARAGDTRCRGSHSLVLLQKPVFSLGRSQSRSRSNKIG